MSPIVGPPVETELPSTGYGTWRLADDDHGRRCVTTAIEVGYRHIDTAQMYGNERAVGAGIAATAIERDELVVATKLWHDSLEPADIRDAVETSLERIGLDRLDLLYVHWPAGTYDAESTLPAMAEVVDDDLVGAIGLSNFTVDLLDAAASVAGDTIAAHQFEMHPFLPNDEVRQRTNELGWTAVAYCPLARGAVFDDETIVDIADRNGISPAQVAIAWLASFEAVVSIPKSGQPDHIRENFAGATIPLADDDLDRIGRIEKRTRLIDPPYAPW